MAARTKKSCLAASTSASRTAAACFVQALLLRGHFLLPSSTFVMPFSLVGVWHHMSALAAAFTHSLAAPQYEVLHILLAYNDVPLDALQ